MSEELKPEMTNDSVKLFLEYMIGVREFFNELEGDPKVILAKSLPALFEHLAEALELMPSDETLRASLAQPKADVEQVEDIVTEAMQDIWNDWCADTGSIPCDFERKGRKTYFQAGKWASNVARQVQCRLAAQGYLCSNDTTKVTQENSYVTEAPPEWQPIESAPKDGTHVWGWNEGDSRSNGYECWFGEDDFILGELKWLRGDGDDYSTGHYYIPCRPTHWMSLPAAPKKEGV